MNRICFTLKSDKSMDRLYCDTDASVSKGMLNTIF